MLTVTIEVHSGALWSLDHVFNDVCAPRRRRCRRGFSCVYNRGRLCGRRGYPFQSGIDNARPPLASRATHAAHVESDFMHQSGAQRLRDVERFYAELEILARAELFVGNQKSNVWRVVHHMRFDKAPHSSLTVHTFQGSGRPTCCVGPVPERMKWVSTSGWCSGDCTA